MNAGTGARTILGNGSTTHHPLTTILIVGIRINTNKLSLASRFNPSICNNAFICSAFCFTLLTSKNGKNSRVTRRSSGSFLEGTRYSWCSGSKLGLPTITLVFT